MATYPTLTIQATYLYVGDENPVYTDGKYKTDIYGAVVHPDTAVEITKRNPKIKVGVTQLAILKKSAVAYLEVFGATKIEMTEEDRRQAEITLFEKLIKAKSRDLHLKTLQDELAKRETS